MDPARYLKLTAPLAKKLGWWWRDQPPKFLLKELGSDDAEFVQQIFAARFEESAWWYEVGRRLGRIDGEPFSKLSLEAMEAVVQNHPPADLGSEVMEVSGSMVETLIPPPGWTRFYVASFNLAHSNEALMRQVEGFLERQREKLKMHRESRSNKGRRNRPVSWLFIENFDLRQYKIDHPKAKLPVEIDHSMVSKMKKM